MRYLALILLLLCGDSLSVMCQSPPDEPELPVSVPSSARPSTPQQPKKIFIRRNVWVDEYRFNAEERRLLEPAVEDQDQWSTFLRLPDTGLVRLYPWARRRRVVSIDDLADGRTPDFNLYASSYSFSKGKYGNGLHGFVDPRLGWAELRLRDGRFYTGFTGDSLGVLVSLRDTPLDSVTPQSDGAIGLTNIVPPADSLEATSLSRRNRAGFALSRFRYGSSLPVAANTTYVMRSTSNRRSDILVTFRVIRVAPDGNVTIVWRKLMSYPKPEWKRRGQ